MHLLAGAILAFTPGIKTPSGTCSGGVLYDTPPRYRTLAYGRTWRTGAITCTSRVTGLTCSARGHGIFISRASWRGW